MIENGKETAMDRIKMLEIVDDLVYRGWELGDAADSVTVRHGSEEDLEKETGLAQWLVDEWERTHAWNPGPDCATRTGMYDD